MNAWLSFSRALISSLISDISDIFFLPKFSSFDFLINADKDSCCRVRSFVISKGFLVKSIVLKMWLRSSSLFIGRLGKKVLKKCEGSLLTSSKISLEKLISSFRSHSIDINSYTALTVLESESTPLKSLPISFARSLSSLMIALSSRCLAISNKILAFSLLEC